MTTRPFYSVTFGGKNTWDEWNLIPIHEGNIEFVSPAVKEEYADVPGMDGSLDMTEVLTGYPLYKNRVGTLKFRFFDNGTPARIRYNSLKNFLHGQEMRAVIEDEPEYYYEGRFAVGNLEYAHHGNWADTTISYNVKPYKNNITSSVENWLWDPFNFETGVIREYNHIEVSGSKTVTVVGSRKPAIPRFIVTSGPLVLSYNGNDYDLPIGTTVIPQIVLTENEYSFRFTGTGVVSISFRGGSL